MVAKGITRLLLIVGVALPLALYVLDNWVLPGKFHKETPLGIQQPTLVRTEKPQPMIDPVTGALKLSGYGLDMEDNIIVNYKDAKPISKAHASLNRLQYRAWNYHLLYTPKHVIQFIFVDVLSTGSGGKGVCPSNIIIFEKSNPGDTMKKVEEATFNCPVFNRELMFDFNQPAYLEGNNGNLHMSVTKTKGTTARSYTVKLLSKDKKLDLDLELTFNYDDGPSVFYAVPMSRDKTSYFSSMKKSNLLMTGQYSYQGKKYDCTQKGQCLMMIDTGRTHNPYGVQYFWVLLMTKLADGRVVTISMADGLSSNYDALDQANEDFISIDKKLYRLDVSRMESEDNQQYVSEKRILTAQETPYHKRMFPSNACDLHFEPVIASSPQSMINDGLNLVLFAFSQRLVYGHFSGTCQVEGQTVKIERAYGHVEYVYSRW